jgi:hypothetical protein
MNIDNENDIHFRATVKGKQGPRRLAWPRFPVVGDVQLEARSTRRSFVARRCRRRLCGLCLWRRLLAGDHLLRGERPSLQLFGVWSGIWDRALEVRIRHGQALATVTARKSAWARNHVGLKRALCECRRACDRQSPNPEPLHLKQKLHLSFQETKPWPKQQVTSGSCNRLGRALTILHILLLRAIGSRDPLPRCHYTICILRHSQLSSPTLTLVTRG